MKTLAWVATALLVLAGLALALPVQVDRVLNAVVRDAPPRVSSRGRALHARLFVADLHADSLLWGRGHVDVPRLRAGNVALQAFTVVTKTPRHMNYESNDASTDNLTLLAVFERWPPAAWGSLLQRGLYQARRLREACARSEGALTLVQSADELAVYRDRRRRKPGLVAGLLGLEGAHALEGNLDNLDPLFAAGFRTVGLVHFFDNDVAGSAHGLYKGGLTALGRELVRRLEARRMLVDLAHASPRTIEDVLAQATRPLIVSHTGVKGTCDNTRNLSDDQLRRIAATGGVVGIGVWEQAVCGRDGAAVARAIRHAVQAAGVEHVGFGSDFDGAVAAPFDASGLAEVTDALLAEGFSEADVARVMGGNVARLLETALPGPDALAASTGPD